MSILVKKKSNISGFGIFAINFVLKESNLYVVPLREIFSAPVRRCAYIENNKWVFDEDVLNWVNHSCDPNSILDISGGQPILVALKDIQDGEEITCDYSLTERGAKEVKCKCGSNKCRGYFLIR